MTGKYSVLDVCSYIIDVYYNEDIEMELTYDNLQFLLFSLQAAVLVLTDEPLFKEDIEVREDGWYVPEVEKKYGHYGALIIEPLKDDETYQGIRISDQKIIMQILGEEVCDCKNRDRLYKNHPTGAQFYKQYNTDTVIPKETIQSMFWDSVNQYED